MVSQRNSGSVVVEKPVRSSSLDESQRQELTWMLDEAEKKLQAWGNAGRATWPEILVTLVSRLRLCGFDLEADGIEHDRAITPKIGIKGIRNLAELFEVRKRVVRRIHERIAAINRTLLKTPSEAKSNGGRCNRDEANIRAREALKNSRIKWSVRSLAKAIGCSQGLISKLPAWQAYQKAHPRKPKFPKAVSLTPALLATTAADSSNEDLQRLMAEQNADDLADKRRYRRRVKV